MVFEGTGILTVEAAITNSSMDTAIEMTLDTEYVVELENWNMRKFAGYPISIYNKLIQGIMIYIVPFAFVNYFPAQFLLRKPDMVNYPDVYMYIAPLIGVVVYLTAYVFWRISVKHYKSTGN